MDNKALWNSVSKTDPRAVKPITGKTYKGNSPKPYWLIERATEEFGPIGIGWGFDVKSERFERMGEFDVLHVAVVSVWYVRDGIRSQTFDQMGGTKAAYMSSKGSLIVDEDAGKKSVTDGMVKCLSMIGFAGDIFSGRWDDSKYVEETAAEFIAKDKADAEAQRLQARAEWMEAAALKLESSEDINELGSVWREIVRVIKAEDDQEAQATLEPIKDRMKTALQPQGAKA